MRNANPPTVPATGWILDNHGLAHQVYDRGPVCTRAWCLKPLMGPVVADVSVTTHRCHACQRAVRAAADHCAEASMVQGRLF